MLHPDIHVLLHKNQHQERMKQVENERLVQLVSHPATQLQSVVELSSLISRWWTRHWQTAQENHVVEGKVIIP